MKKCIKIVSAVCLMVILTTQNVFANVSLSITPELQQMSNWCWAATSVSVAKYYGKTTLYYNGYQIPTNQSNHVLKATNIANNNVQRNFIDIQTDFSNCYNLSCTYYANPLTTTVTNSQLYSNKPVYIRIGWNGGSSGHAMLITGYLTSGSLYRVMDPATGGHSYYLFSSITTYVSPVSGSTGTWSHTLYNF